MDPDVALLQEVCTIPKDIETSYDTCHKKATTKTGNPQRFGTAILVKGKIVDNLLLSSKYEWVNRELEFFSGNIISGIVEPIGQKPINVVSVHSPAWPVDRDRLKGIDVTPVKLRQNPDVWVTEILWSALKNANISENERWIVGGDLNSSETFDILWKGGPRGNLEILERMYNLGFTECLREYKGELTPTFKNPKGGKIIHQIDHLFVTKPLFSSVRKCSTGEQSVVFDKSLSDHLPIIGDFRDY